jgi:hypothetical protein
MGQNVSPGRYPKMPQFGENDPSSEFLWLDSEISPVAYRERQGAIPLRQPKDRNDTGGD